MRRQVFIVEGYHDASKLKEVLGDIEVLITNGSAVSSETLHLIEKLDETHDLIVFTDPDYAGQRIRHLVSKNLEHVYHAFLKQDKAVSKNKKKIGVEHASKDDILYALRHMKLVKTADYQVVSTHFLYTHGLIGQKDSKKKRLKLSEELHIGYTNGKTLKQRLMMFQITPQQIKEVLYDTST